MEPRNPSPTDGNRLVNCADPDAALHDQLARQDREDDHAGNPWPAPRVMNAPADTLVVTDYETAIKCAVALRRAGYEHLAQRMLDAANAVFEEPARPCNVRVLDGGKRVPLRDDAA